jgi:two-component system chemotaxis response regulator CheB
MSNSKQVAVVTLSGTTDLRALTQGEILQGEYHGNPLVTVYDPSTKTGGGCYLDRHAMESGFASWYERLVKEFAGSDVMNLQIKFIVGHSEEKTLKALCVKNGVVPQAIACVDEKARLDVFFFADSGRLRIAPAASSFRDTSKTINAVKQKKNAKVLIVDDSKTMRKLLRKIIEQSPDLEVVGEAELPSQVEMMIAKTQPDVMTLDINMPEMSGVQLLSKILSYRFLPTVMISAMTMNDGEEVLNALELGAVDYIHKPEASELAAMTPFIQEKILSAARVRRSHILRKRDREQGESDVRASTMGSELQSPEEFSAGQIIAIGASTGGTEAIKQILMSLPKEIPPIVVVQHIPPFFSTAFSKRLNEVCQFEVREAEDGDEVRSGRVLIAPGGRHMEVVRKNSKLYVHVSDGEAVNRFKPSVDVLFRSVARVLGAKATGVILTGMGHDGAAGLLAMRKNGAFTIAQDEESSIVFGMPRAAAEMGAATIVEPLENIANVLLSTRKAA